MDKVYAMPGAAIQQVGGEPSAGWVEMRGYRPSLDHVATEVGVWVLSAPSIPPAVSRYQGREAMRITRYGDPEGGVSVFDAALALLARPDTPAYYVRAWDDLQTFDRDSAMLTAVADELGLTSADLDALFILAASLKA